MSSSGVEGKLRIWDMDTNREILTFVFFPKREWAVIANDGYFCASKNAKKLLTVQRGISLSTIEDGLLATWKITRRKKPSINDSLHLLAYGYPHKTSLFKSNLQKMEATSYLN